MGRIVSDNADFKVDHQFAVLRLLDETAQLYMRKLAREYFAPHELNKFQENRLWLRWEIFPGMPPMPIARYLIVIATATREPAPSRRKCRCSRRVRCMP